MNFTGLPPQSIIETLHYDEWTIKDFKILFLFSERVLTAIKNASQVINWYKDPVVASFYIDQVNTCFTSIRQFYKAFGVLPQVGDRLYDQDAGLLVTDLAGD